MSNPDARPTWIDHHKPGWKEKWEKWLSRYKGKNVLLRPGAQLHTSPHQVDIQVTGKSVRVTLRRTGVSLPSDEISLDGNKK